MLVWADCYVPAPDGLPEEFTPMKQDLGGGKEMIFAKLKNGAMIRIGQRNVGAEIAGGAEGVVPESIHVSRLRGTPDLLYCQWNDYLQGMGCYQSAYYLFCTADNPETTLVRGSVPISGHWGCATGISGGFSMRYRDSVLRIRVTTTYNDTSPKPKPLYRLVPREQRSPVFSFARSTTQTVTRVFAVRDGKVELRSTLLEYQVQDGDTLDAICDGLQVKREWVQNPELLEMQVSTIPIVIPVDAALKRYPTIQPEEL